METVKPNGLIECIFIMQASLMNQYVALGKLDPFPLKLDTKPGQKDVRDTIGCIIEEMSEAYDEAEEIYLLLSDNQQRQAEVKHAYFHEELADVIHFFIELLIQSGITQDDIVPYMIHRNMIEDGDQDVDGFEALSTLIRYATLQNRQTLPDSISRKECFIVPNTKIQHRGLNYVNLELLQQFACFEWGIVNSLMKAQNKLRAQPWRDQVYSVDIRSYHTHLMEAFEYLIRMLAWLGLTDYSIMHIYHEKNTKNIERIKQGY